MVGARFSAPILTSPRTYPASYTMSTGSFLGVKRLGCGIVLTHESTNDITLPEWCRLHENMIVLHNMCDSCATDWYLINFLYGICHLVSFF
jgi:hypothetical protein